MSGLSVYNRCIPQISSCLASSDADDSAYVRSMTSRQCTRRSSSSTDETHKVIPVGFWRSWEFLRHKISEKKDSSCDDTQGNEWIFPIHKGGAEANVSSRRDGDAATELEGCLVMTRSASLDDHVSSQKINNERRIEKYNTEEWEKSEESLTNPSSSKHVEHDDISEIELNHTVKPESKKHSNINSKGAIPKQKNVTCNRKKGENGEVLKSFESGDYNRSLSACYSSDAPVPSKNSSYPYPMRPENLPNPTEKFWNVGIRNLNDEGKENTLITIFKGKTQDSKNMTSLLSFRNQSLGKDVLDNGIALLSAKLQVDSTRDRLKTFKNWPNKRIEPKKLAEAGFFYCGRADIVECFRCGIKGHNWVENDKPMDDHMRWNKDCPFVRENTTEHDNIRVRQGQDICGNLGVEILPNSQPEDITESQTSLEKLGIQKAKGPSHPDQILYETRLATFGNWPKCMKQKPPELANAGFYYLGVGDQTLCFYCGGGLKDWDEEDDPWEQHALWFPKCNFLLLKKTPAFVEAVHEKHKGLLSSKKEETEIEASCSSHSDTKETSSNLSLSTEERKSEESTTLCKICFKNELGVVFLPCGHMVACTDCASALKECAVCRKNIQATVRAFIS